MVCTFAWHFSAGEQEIRRKLSGKRRIIGIIEYHPATARSGDQKMASHPSGPASKQNVPLVRAAILAPVVAAYEAQGNLADKILNAHGINAARLMDQNAFITHDTAYTVYEEIARSTQPDFAAKVAQSLDWRIFAPMAPELNEAVTLGDFITRFTTAVARESNAVSQSLLVEGEYAHYAVKRGFQPSVSPAQSDAFQIALWIGLLHRVLDFRWDPGQVIVQLYDPSALPKEFHGIRPIKCNAQGFSFRFPSVWLSHRISPDLVATSQGPPMGRELSAPADTLASVANVLRRHLGDPEFNVETAAMACGYNADTLNRRLAAYGKTISAVIADLKRAESEAALEYGAETISEIAQRLGYSDATAFSRAFKKWRGVSPSNFRKEKKKTDK